MSWTDDKVKLMATLLKEGWSCGQIAKKLDTSRNAVIGKMHRLGTSLTTFVGGASGLERPERHYHKNGGAKPTRKAWRPTSQTIAETAVITVPEPPPAIPHVGPIPLMELRHDTCRWPVNNGHPEYLFCGVRCDPGPYCDKHARKAYTPMKR